MKLLILSAFLYSVVNVSGEDDSGWSLVGNPLIAEYPCTGLKDIQLIYEVGTSPELENKYKLWINKTFPEHTDIKLKFDKGATVKLSNKTYARIYLDTSEDHAFRIRFFESHKGIGFHVQGCELGVIPYIRSININTKEYCQEPLMGFLDPYIEGYKDEAQSPCTKQKQHKVEYNTNCGRRQSLLPNLKVNGESQRSDWPWHTALYLMDGSTAWRYRCGGTLISNRHVLTVAHCVSRRGFYTTPENMKVILGKYDLPQMSESGAEERKVEKFIIHKNYDLIKLDNDIALIQLKTDVPFTEFIQPACLWNKNAYEKLEKEPTVGTIVGWVFDDDNIESNKLSQLQMQMIPDDVCIRTKPEFYSRTLNGKKFCAGDLKEAVACTGDSGGGFHVFIPDNVGDNSSLGTWYIRGIISHTVSNDDRFTCSNTHYTVFTDVGKYTEWVVSHM